MIRILHLYYDLLNLYGEYGNVVVLSERLKKLGLEVRLDRLTLADDINFADYDFIYCGSGTESNLKLALGDLLRRKELLDKAVEGGSLLLFTGNAMALLGECLDNEKALAYGHFKTVTTKERFTGDVIVKNDLFGECVGFINKCTKTELVGAESLFKYVYKANDEDAHNNDLEYEGFHSGNIFATYIIGPLLVKNPAILKYFLGRLSKQADFEYNYPYADESYQVTLKALKERMS